MMKEWSDGGIERSGVMDVGGIKDDLACEGDTERCRAGMSRSS